MDRPEDRQLMLMRDYRPLWFLFQDNVLVCVGETFTQTKTHTLVLNTLLKTDRVPALTDIKGLSWRFFVVSHRGTLLY